MNKHDRNVKKARERSIRNNLNQRRKSPSKMRRLARRAEARAAAANTNKVQKPEVSPSTKDLKAWATAAKIPGRSKMNREQLLVAYKASK